MPTLTMKFFNGVSQKSAKVRTNVPKKFDFQEKRTSYSTYKFTSVIINQDNINQLPQMAKTLKTKTKKKVGECARRDWEINP